MELARLMGVLWGTCSSRQMQWHSTTMNALAGWKQRGVAGVHLQVQAARPATAA